MTRLQVQLRKAIAQGDLAAVAILRARIYSDPWRPADEGYVMLTARVAVEKAA